MKTLTLLIAICFTTALISLVAADDRASSQNTIAAADNSNHTVRKHFNGTLTGAESYRLLGDPPSGFFVDGAGTAISTQLGQFTWVYVDMVAFADFSPLTTPGRARFIADNGDNLFTSSDALVTPTPDPLVSNVLEMHTVTGGTGQFAGAKGNFTINRVTSSPSPEALDGTTTGFFHGTILLKHHGH